MYPPTTVTERRAAALLSAAAAAPVRANAGAGDEDERFMKRKATVSALTRTRLNALVPRLSALVAALEQRLRLAAEAEAEGEEARGEAEGEGEVGAADGGVAWTQEPALTTAQMLEKLAFVADATAAELHVEAEDKGDKEADEAVDWSPLLTAVMGDGSTGDALVLVEANDAARGLDAELAAELARAADRQPTDAAMLLAMEKAVTRHLRAVLVAPVAGRGGASNPFSVHSTSSSASDAAHHSLRHSLRQLLSEFRGVFTTCYKPFVQPVDGAIARRHNPNADDGDRWALRLTSALPLAVADVLRFAGLLTQVLRAKHPLLRLDSRPEADAKAANLVRRLVLDALFDALQRTLHELIGAVFSREDSLLGDVAYLSRASPPAAFGVREALRLDGSWVFAGDDDTFSDRLNVVDEEDDGLEPEQLALERRQRIKALGQYGGALFWLDSLSTSSRAPSEKLRRVVRACKAARESPARFYSEQWTARCRQRGLQVAPEGGDDAETLPTPEELILSPADLHALLGFVLSAARNTSNHAFSHLAIMRILEPLVPPADVERSAAVAALQGAVQRMMPTA